MKTGLTILICVLSTLPIYAQWEKVDSHLDDPFSFIDVYDIFFVNDSVGFSLSSGSSILKTTDGGEHWTEHPTIFTYSWFNDIDFPTENIGYACGGTAFGTYTNIIAKTTDGGQTWDSLTSNVGEGYAYHKIHFLNADEGFVAPESNKLLKTVDGGESFEEVEILTSNNTFIRVTDITSTENQTCLVSTNEYSSNISKRIHYIKRSVDLGNTWNTVYTDTINDEGEWNKRQINKMFFVNNSVGYAVGGNGLFLKTTDGGESWDKQQIAPYTHLSSVYFTDTQVGYINNAGGIYKTKDGGETWNAQNITPLEIIRGYIQFTNDSIGYAVSNNNRIYKTTSAGENQLNITTLKNSSIRLYPNPTTKSFQIDTQQPIQTVSIFNLQGKHVKTFRQPQRSYFVTDIAKGIYLLRLQTQQGEKVTKKLVIE